MTQPELVLSCSTAAALVGTVGIAKLSGLQTLGARVVCTAIVISALTIGISSIAGLRLRVNLTPSMPVGIYQMLPPDGKGIQRGDLLIACAPIEAAELGRKRGYLAPGTCPMNTEPLLKEIVAVAGDVVDASPRGVVVNGKLLSNSSALGKDASGRKLTPWRAQNDRLRHNEVWLYSNNPSSWDSRYWGPASRTSIIARARTLH